jgi:hypothetical protein
VGALTATLAALSLAAAAPRALVVRISPGAAPCIEAAARDGDPSRPRLVLNVGRLEDQDDADLFVGSAPAVTRAIESGAALDADETDLARIPWVLSVAPGTLPELRALDDLRLLEVVVGMPAGPEFVEGRRALATLPEERVQEVEDPRALRTSLVALTPLSLAPTGRRIAVEGVAPLIVRGAVGTRARDVAAARGVLRFLAEATARAPGVCGAARP